MWTYHSIVRYLPTIPCTNPTGVNAGSSNGLGAASRGSDGGGGGCLRRVVSGGLQKDRRNIRASFSVSLEPGINPVLSVLTISLRRTLIRGHRENTRKLLRGCRLFRHGRYTRERRADARAASKAVQRKRGWNILRIAFAMSASKRTWWG
jgi:hypothetical protein